MNLTLNLDFDTILLISSPYAANSVKLPVDPRQTHAEYE